MESDSILSASSLLDTSHMAPGLMHVPFTRFRSLVGSQIPNPVLEFLSLSEEFFFVVVPLWIHQPNYHEQPQLRQTVSTTFQLMFSCKHLGLHVFTPPLPPVLLFPLSILKQARWKKNCVQQTIRFFRVTTMRHVKWTDIALSTTEANPTCLFSPYWEAEPESRSWWEATLSVNMAGCLVHLP